MPLETAPLAAPRRSRVTVSTQKLQGGVFDIAQQLIRDAEGYRNDCTVLYAAPARANTYRTVLQVARAVAQAGKTVLLVDADSEAGLTRHVSATGRPGLLDSVSLRRIEGEFVTLPSTRGLWVMPAGQRSPRIATRRAGETGTLVDWLEATDSAFDLVLVYAGRADQPRPIPAVEMAADRFAVIGSRIGRTALDEAVSRLEQRGLSPVMPFFVDDAQAGVSRAS